MTKIILQLRLFKIRVDLIEISSERRARFREVAERRQFDLTLILENVHDPHNIGAVLRTADAVGVAEVFLLNTDPRIISKEKEIGHSSSSGAVQWIPIHFYHNVEECMTAVKRRYDHVLGTMIGQSSISLYDVDLTKSVALMFGNEHEGISKEAAAHLDQNFLIPQGGFTKSLNISVACAVSLYETYRQRSAKGFYDQARNKEYSESVFASFVDIHQNKMLANRNRRIDFK